MLASVAKRLTPKQERFVQALVSGASQREAYLAAYDCGRMKPESIDSCACRLLANNVKVSSRYDELMAELAAAVLWDRAEAARGLIEVREIARQAVRNKWAVDGVMAIGAADSLTRVTAELNKMFRVYDTPDDGDGRVTVIDDV